MLRQTRNFAVVALVALAAALGAACVSTSLPDEATAQHRYYAALADYNQAKRVAAAYVALPETPASHAQAVLDVVEDVDQRVRDFEDVRRAGEAGPSQYSTIAAVLDFAADRLRAYAISGDRSLLEDVKRFARGEFYYSASLDPAVALLLLKLIGIVSAGLKLTPELVRRKEEHVAKIEQMIREERQPSDEEIDALLTEGDLLTSEIRASRDAKVAAEGESPPAD